MIFVIETIDVVEGPHDTALPERTMSGPYPDVDEALALAERPRQTTVTPSSTFCTNRRRSSPQTRRRDRDAARNRVGPSDAEVGLAVGRGLAL